MERRQRYTWSAPLYDVVSLEPLYRVGRREAVRELRLAPGQRVLDLGCGTGLSLPLLRARVGAQGAVVGLDASDSMLDQARRRVRRAGWSNVDLVAGDATAVAEGLLGRRFDAVLATYVLSLVPDWRAAWRSLHAAVRPGGRVAVVDLARPDGAARLLTPLARLACAVGGSDIDARPWQELRRLEDVGSATFRGGHVQVWSATRSDPAAAALRSSTTVATNEGRELR